MSLDFLVHRTEPALTRIIERPALEPADGQVVARVEKFAFTANNISYRITGDSIGYWKFFPVPEEGWGRIPAFGFATVERSRSAALKEGTRFFGYFTTSSHLVMEPEHISEANFIDHMPHRRELHAVYNSYSFLGADPAYHPDFEDMQALLRPQYTTSFLIDHFVVSSLFFGARQVLVLSASSKTAIGFAYAQWLRGEGRPDLIGVTSPGNLDFVRRLGCYDRSVSYDALTELDPSVPTLIVDFAGDGQVVATLHRHFADNIRYNCAVGKSHWAAAPVELPGRKPKFFFAPNHAMQLIGEIGADEFWRRLNAGWSRLRIDAARWIMVETGRGPGDLSELYARLLAGTVPPDRGHMIGL